MGEYVKRNIEFGPLFISRPIPHNSPKTQEVEREAGLAKISSRDVFYVIATPHSRVGRSNLRTALSKGSIRSDCTTSVSSGGSECHLWSYACAVSGDILFQCHQANGRNV